MDSIMREKIEELKALVEKSEVIYISSHVRPDGDSIGSLLGLGKGLLKQYPEKKIMLRLKDEVPSYLGFLDVSLVKQTDVYEEKGILLALDCGDKSRIGIDGLENIETLVNIDHHMTNPNFGDLNIVLSDASSTSEIVYDILHGLGVEIDPEIAEPIYTGISMDSGSFKYQSTGARTHEIAAELIRTGFDKEKVVRKLYQSNTLSEMLLIKESMERIEFLRDNSIAMLLITEEILENSGMDIKEVDSIVEIIRDIDTVELVFVLKPFEDKTKVSIRSKEKYDSSEIAQNFGGGGHMRAAGCKIDGDMQQARKLILEAIGEGV
ncbi:bifunctional oligoribonuclease and PAP phosphatase NrnA [Andreesenia angusta]|uniref:Bifunctional oligoribonuclease and PAP phosphatase NrnA n=2 Tax=Andreesenia angusta TaxID=39480 RepID=A0A1S1V8S1_9FIRM|nr:bifunctional oligoribonuclease and PAP phosphatase NrnA [Andreesenia angusta]